MKNVVVFKLRDKAEQTKNFPDFMRHYAGRAIC